MKLRVRAAYFRDGISILGGNKSITCEPGLIQGRTVSAAELGSQGLLVEHDRKLVLVPWAQVESVLVEREEPEEPKERGKPGPKPKAAA